MSAAVSDNRSWRERTKGSSNSQECMEAYKSWAERYDTDMVSSDYNYVGPSMVIKAVLSTSKASTDGVALDAGCGTGLVGQLLSTAGFQHIDGLDLSPDMLRKAEAKGIYRDLTEADMNQPLDKASGTYDVVTCCGTFVSGHVGPDPGLRELVRVTKQGGVVVATIAEALYEPKGFKTEVTRLRTENLVEVLGDELTDYVKGHGDKANYLVLRKI